MGVGLKTVLRLGLALLLIQMPGAVRAFPSGTQAADWLRVRGEGGNYAFDIPPEHRVFYNESGFSVTEGSGDHALTKVYILSSYVDGVLISAEIFEGGPSAFGALYAQDAFAKQGRKVRDVKVGEAKGKEVENRTTEYHSLRWFVRNKSQIFVLTAASRTADMPVMRRFLDSFMVGESGSIPAERTTAINKLDPTEVAIEFDTDAPLSTKPKAAPTPAQAPEPDVKPAVLVRMTHASFVAQARENGVDGIVRLKLLVDKDGFIPKITVSRGLPQGLLRQSLFAALRSKFLPKEKGGVPVSVTKTVEFSFSIR